PLPPNTICIRPLDFFFSGTDRTADTMSFDRNIHHPHSPVGANVTEALHGLITPLPQHSNTPPNVPRRSRSFCDSVDSSLENRAAAVFGRLLQGIIAVAPHRSRMRAEVS